MDMFERFFFLFFIGYFSNKVNDKPTMNHYGICSIFLLSQTDYSQIYMLGAKYINEYILCIFATVFRHVNGQDSTNVFSFSLQSSTTIWKKCTPTYIIFLIYSLTSLNWTLRVAFIWSIWGQGYDLNLIFSPLPLGKMFFKCEPWTEIT